MAKKGFYVQTHLHTSESSDCGRATAVDMVRACKAAGYDLIAITDHFVNVEFKKDCGLTWEEKIHHLFEGYRAAKAEGDRLGIEVLQAWESFIGGWPWEGTTPPEERRDGQELLTYGLGEDFLLANPDLEDVTYYEYIRRVTEAGGVIVHAHPYRKAWYIPPFTPDPKSVEAYEVYNDHNKDPEWNRLALAEAKANGLLMMAGADAHRAEDVATGAMRFSRPVHSMAEIFAALREGDGQIIEKLPPADQLT